MSSAGHGWIAKVGTFLTFVPVLAITTIIWAALLTAVV
jgi:hypothetical protein